MCPLQLQSQQLEDLGSWRTSRKLKLNNETKVNAPGEIKKNSLVELSISLTSLFIKHFLSLSY